MSDPQTCLEQHAIQAHCILIGTSQEGEVEEHGDFVLGYTGADLPTFNFFIPLTLTGLTDDTLADAAAFFRTRDTPYSVSLEEHRVPDGTEFLSRRRYQPLPPQPVMVLDDLQLNQGADDSLLIEGVETVPGLTAFYTVLESVFDFNTEEVMLLFPTTQLGETALKHFVGFVDEQPVSAITAVYSHDVVSIWNMSTLDDFRRQGYAASLLRYVLADAVVKGCNQSMVYATPMSFSLLNKFGYQLYAMRQWFLPQAL